MKNVKKISLVPTLFDTFNVDYTTLENSVIIPFRTEPRFREQNRDTYNWIISNDTNMTDKQNVIILLVEALDGHHMYNYDGCYKYFLGAIVSVNGVSQLFKKEITVL